MKVNLEQLITLLINIHREHGNLPVTVDGYESGVTEHLGLKVTKVETNVNNSWWEGEHEESDTMSDLTVLNISRESKS